MKTHIYLVRHGEVYNPKGILYGRLPGFPLTEKGKLEIAQTANFLAGKHISHVYSSPLLRAKQTAKIIQNKLGIERINQSKQILEVRSSFQGKLLTDLDPQQNDIYLSPLRKPSDETIEQMAMRMQKFITYLAQKNPGQNIVFVTHGDPAMVLKADINNIPLDINAIESKPYIQHGEVMEITVDPHNKLHISSVFKPEVKTV